MDFDLKTISVVLGIASSFVALAYKLKPNPSARLKRDLELLKLARETKANYFALQRHVDAQIRNEFVVRGLNRRKRFELYYGELSFSAILGVVTFGFLGSLTALAAKAIFSIEDTTAAIIIGTAAVLGLLGGISHGSEVGGNRVRDAEREVAENEMELIESDEVAIREIRKNDA